MPTHHWPQEWEGLFDSISTLDDGQTIRFSHRNAEGWAIWEVLAGNDVIGDFGLGVGRDTPSVIEVHSVNLKPDLVGQRIMRRIVEHGVEFCPTPYVVCRVWAWSGVETYNAMRSWGWRNYEDGSEALRHWAAAKGLPEELWEQAFMQDRDYYLGNEAGGRFEEQS